MNNVLKVRNKLQFLQTSLTQRSGNQSLVLNETDLAGLFCLFEEIDQQLLSVCRQTDGELLNQQFALGSR